MTTDVLSALIAVLATLVVALGVWVAVLHLRLARAMAHYQRLHAGVSGQRLDQVLEAHVAAAEAAAAEARRTAERCDELAERLRGALQHVGVVRFNPFDDTGGDQSFAIAVTNADGDGFMLSALHSRAGTRAYAKPLRGGTSRYPLSQEEEQALFEAGLSRR